MICQPPEAGFAEKASVSSAPTATQNESLGHEAPESVALTGSPSSSR